MWSRGCVRVFALLVMFTSAPSDAQTIDELKSGVVKITATVEGKTRVGTGFIVRLEKDAAYIVTAAHVVEGDSKPKVAFFPQANRFVEARVLGMEGGDSNGLAALVVEKRVPGTVHALCFEENQKVGEGASVTAIGFPTAAATPWMVTSGTLSGRRGTTLTFTGIVGEGNSGGPLIVDDRVVGVITEMREKIGYAVPMVTAKFALEGWGVSLPALAECWKKVITSKDGSAMVLIPAGPFITHEIMLHGMGMVVYEDPLRLYVNDFYIDKQPVTVAQYSRFLQTTAYRKPRSWESSGMSSSATEPAYGVSWNRASAYCQWVGKRLPTEDEWEKATSLSKKSIDEGFSELTASFYHEARMSSYEGRNSDKRVVRGGVVEANGKLDYRARYSLSPDSEVDDVTFRCAKDVGPER